MQLESTEPILLNDEQMREYIANGYVILRPSLSEELHRTIDEKFNWIQEHEFNPGNNIVPRLPELELILRSPEVHGALVSVLGENYLTHPHRCWHFLPSANESLAKEAVAERLAGGCHLDQYTPSSQPRSHRTRYARVMYYPQDTPIELGPTHVVPGSHYHEGLTDEDRQIFENRYEHLYEPLALRDFNDHDLFAREAMQPFYENGGWQEEVLCSMDTVLVGWRRLVSRYNRGIQAPRAPI